MMRKHKSNKLLTILTLFLMGAGLIIIYAIGPLRANFLNSALGFEKYGVDSFFWHQLFCVIAAVVVFGITFKFPYEKIRGYAKIVMIVGLGLCAILQIFAWLHVPLASCELGACRWYNLGPAGFQPAEVLKLGLIMYLAQLAAERRKEGKLNSREFWVPFVGYSVLSLFFVVVLQKDLGTGIVMVVIVLAMLFMSGVEMKYFGIVVAAVLLLGLFAIFSSEHRRERLLTFGAAEGSDSYHIDNAMLAIGTGGFWGVGIGNSVQATGYLPESINDSVFAVMGETFGFFGLMLILICYLVLLTQLLKVSEHLQDLEQSLVVVGVFAWVMTHVVVNIGAMTGIIPLTGITLPLLSYGGTSMLFISAALGVSLQLSCYTGREVRKNEDISSRRGVRGTHYTGRRSRA